MDKNIINKTPNNIQEVTANDKIMLNNEKKTIQNPTPYLTQNDVIVKKKQYKQFYKLVKNGKFTNAVISARIIGVARQTISKWLETPMIKQAMDNDINEYIEGIRGSNDWKAKAYLLDKLEDKNNSDTNKVNLQQLIVINTTQ